jgi:hypothetical protein
MGLLSKASSLWMTGLKGFRSGKDNSILASLIMGSRTISRACYWPIRGFTMAGLEKVFGSIMESVSETMDWAFIRKKSMPSRTLRVTCLSAICIPRTTRNTDSESNFLITEMCISGTTNSQSLKVMDSITGG